MKKLVNNPSTNSNTNIRPGVQFKYVPSDIDQNEAWAKIERLRKIFEGKLNSHPEQQNQTTSSLAGGNGVSRVSDEQREYSINASSTPRQGHPQRYSDRNFGEDDTPLHSGTKPINDQLSSFDSDIRTDSSIGIGKSVDFEQYSSRIYGRRRHIGADPELDRGAGVDEGIDLEYYPKLVSPGTLLSERGASRSNTGIEYGNMGAVGTEGLSKSVQRTSLGDRRGKRRRDLRNTGAQYVQGVLGDPLPLPYIKKADERPFVTNEPYSFLSAEKLGRKTREIESKWKKLVLQDKIAVEKRMKELQDYETSRSFSFREPVTVSGSVSQHMDTNKLSMGESTRNTSRENEGEESSLLTELGPLPASSNQGHTPLDSSMDKAAESKGMRSFQTLQSDVLNNGKKLDLIIHLLDKRETEPPSRKNAGRWKIPKWFWHGPPQIKVSKEDLLWIGCIILLILFNVYVYYYV